MKQLQGNEEIEQDDQVVLQSSSSQVVININDGELFDYIEKEIDEDLICSICLNPFVDPISHSTCGNTFCSKCAEDVLKCPMCSEDDFKKNCVPSAKTIRNMLDKLKVKCSMCKNIVSRGELKDHKEKYCPLHDAYKQVEQLKEQLQHEFDENHTKLEQEFQEKREQLEQELKEKREEFEKQVKLKEELLQERIAEFDSRVYTREKIENSNKPIHLNVRGTIMTVSLGTFINNEREPENLFKKMFKGEYPIYQTPSKTFEDSIYYIDCDPIIFKHILDWLQFGIVDSELNVYMKQSLLYSCELFNISKITNYLNETIRVCPILQSEFFNSLSANTPLNLSKHNFSKLTLNYLNLKKSTIIESDFSGMNLKGTDFKGSNLRGSNFSNCLLESINFQDCDLSDCNFSNTIFKNVNLTNAKLSNCKFSNTTFEKCKTLIQFHNNNLKDCKFIECEISNDQFSECELSDCKFHQINFKNTIIKKSKMENIEFENCTCSIHFINTTLTNCKKFESKFDNSIFEQIDLQFIESNIFENNNLFNNCLIKNSNLKELKDFSMFRGFTFDSCLFNFNLFTNKIIENVNFENISFENVDFKFFDLQLNSNNNSFNNCIIKNSNLNELKDLSKFKGFKFDSCLFNFNQFTNKQIENIKFENISFEEINFESNELKFKNVKLINCKGFIMESLIIGKNNISSTIFEETKSRSIPELLYRGSRDGFKAINFHSKCDNQGPTLTIIKSEHDLIFGGFTSQSWQSTENYKYVSDNFAFIFKILNFGNGNYQFKKFNIKQEKKDNAIRLNKDCLSTFGGGHDFIISNDCNLNYSGSNFGRSYELPNELKYESDEAKSYLAGSNKFKVKEIEVFKIYQ